MAKEKDEDVERNPETKGRIDKRRREKAELSRGYKEARQELPDNPRDDPWGYTELPARNPAENVIQNQGEYLTLKGQDESDDASTTHRRWHDRIFHRSQTELLQENRV